jgi:Replication-relaxation
MSAYLSRRGFERLRDGLSDRDLAVTDSIQEHRFLTAQHIQALHFGDHSTSAAGARVCRRVLARLAKERVLVRLQRRVGGVRAGSSSYIYALGPIGRRLVAGGRRVTEPSWLFLDHTLAVADARVELVRADMAGKLELVDAEVEPLSWRRYTGPGGASEVVRPDLYVVTSHGEFEDCWFLEIDRGTESPAAVGRKCRAYHAYWRTGAEQAQHGTFPLVLWVVPDVARARRIEKVISSARGLKRELFRMTTGENLVQLISEGAG